jgi:hypothetical protein
LSEELGPKFLDAGLVGCVAIKTPGKEGDHLRCIVFKRGNQCSLIICKVVQFIEDRWRVINTKRNHVSDGQRQRTTVANFVESADGGIILIIWKKEMHIETMHIE